MHPSLHFQAVCAALTGLCSNPYAFDGTTNENIKPLVGMAYEFADEVIKQLQTNTTESILK